jgi:Rieske Fe-S protein
MSEQDQASNPGRRNFIAIAAAGTVGIMGATATAMGTGFLYPVARKPPSPLFVCLESEVPAGDPMELTDLLGRKVLLMHQPGGGLIAVSTVCSHLGCTVYYRPEQKVFDCPCHGGKFDHEGKPIAGPPQTPLARFPVEVREGKVFVQFA